MVSDRSIPWPYVGLGALVGLALVLAGLALRTPEPPAPVIVINPSPGTSGDEESTPTAPRTRNRDDSRPDATQTPPEAGQRRERGPGREPLLDALSATAAVRGRAGSCPGGGAEAAVSVDRGETWSPVPVPADLLLRLTWTGDDAMLLVGATAPACQAALALTDDRGGAWSRQLSASGAWHLMPNENATRLRAPYAIVDSPCGERRTLEVEPTSFDQASVLCGGGEVFTTADSGRSWSSDGTTPNAVAMAVINGSPVVAAASQGACDGLAISGPGSSPVGCVEGAPSIGVALSFQGRRAGWLVSESETWTSRNRGATWQATS